MLIENLSINVTPGGIPVTIHISQYDIGLRTFVFSPYTSHGTFTPDSAAAATLEGTKPDGNVIIHNCQYNSTNGQITYTVQEQLAAVAGKVWSKLTLRDTSGNAIGYTAIIWVVDMAGVEDGAIASDSDISALQEFIAEFGTINAYKAALDGALAAVGGPYVASTVSQMTDHSKVYVYTGTQTGYTAGHWYYWNGSAWTDGGVYQAAAVETDKTLTVTDMAADAKATGDAVTELKNELTAIGDMGDYNIYVTDWTMGRRSSGALSNYYYTSNNIIPIPSKLYFDDANYKISYVQCNAAGTENIGYGSSWKTTSPATLSKTGSYDYCWIEIQHTVAQTSITPNDLEEIKRSTYYVEPIPLVETVKRALTNAYVDGVNGLDTNDGSSSAPFKTISRAVDSGRETIFVANGTYNEFVFIQNREKLAILPWAYPTAFDSSVPDTPKIVITGTSSNTIACAIRAYDCGELTLVGIHGCNTRLSAFELLRSKKIEVVNCWASDVTDSEYNGFKIASCNGVFRNCRAWNIGRDGFGISIYGNTQFIDCVAHDCGDDGVSHHDGCTGAVIGGEYYNCGKGGVASPTYGSYIDVINVYSHDNKYGLYSVTDSSRRRSKSRVSGCVFKDNTDNDIYINNNDIIGWNNIYDNKSLINQATFTEF